MIIAEKLDPNELVTVEELAISGMWEIAALVEVFECKGVLTRQEVLDMIQGLRRRTPRAQHLAPPAEETLPKPYLNTETANRLIEQILTLFNENKLTSQQSRTLLD